MPSKQNRETVRLTIDFPIKQHTYLKMLAAKEGVSLRQFIIEHLPCLDEHGKKKKPRSASDSKFDELLREFLVEKTPMLKRLSKK